MRPMGLFALPDYLARLSATGDPLEVLAKVVDFERFRVPLEAALGYADRAKGGRPPYDPVWPCSRFWCWRLSTRRVTSAWSSCSVTG